MKNIDCSLAGCEKRASLRERDVDDDHGEKSKDRRVGAAAGCDLLIFLFPQTTKPPEGGFVDRVEA
ncbi:MULTISPECIES: hypothetical protein [unclassified Pseudomonas]|uniref:hypothetical protein n=1 Tax=unclassified Pseudomonas TaxID=196821 RepID=UPI001179ADDF|nr:MULTISPECIES: hypothetical protein [unclassified Pseudomonas]MDN4547540.1 hypothetical protein [Pseudomonas sp. C32]